MTTQGNFPLGGQESKPGRATATCYCGTVQIEVATQKPDLVDTFICNCSDCRKITASMFASNFIVTESSTLHLKGQDKLTRYAQSNTIDSGSEMANYFCSVCGTLMYRKSSGFPGKLVTRIGTVDDYSLHEGALKPRVEQFCKDRVKWLEGGEGVEQQEGNYYDPRNS
ncbi:hypothetical protein EG328_008412 [Venturia inaequalis]|uniref:CENP-V/GFA domain-containing protein n=1 Tax=Venturia inaequalis TaxID=5025 RepID=A0A8H3YNF8_VENIN|nr:hypothetical protein EG328_008412 [Venturia inaequalis]KAE9988338.1 hypothetical protein EG327_003407 [Venturia inaequalis]RDI89742.1 hypothetical protein Vi05172_g618 [Venturia inaequalis]